MDTEIQPRAKYDALIARCEGLPPVRSAVVHPCDAHSLQGAIEAHAAGLIDPVLVGPEAKIRRVAKENGIDISSLAIVDAPHSHAAAARAVELVRAGEVAALMKGSLHTDEVMAAVVCRSVGTRTMRRVSHVFIMDVPTHLPEAAVHHRRRRQHRPDARRQGRYCRQRDRTRAGFGGGAAEGGHPQRGRDRHRENSVHDRGRGTVQDGRARADQGRNA
jgi:hypothetical protein